MYTYIYIYIYDSPAQQVCFLSLPCLLQWHSRKFDGSLPRPREARRKIQTLVAPRIEEKHSKNPCKVRKAHWTNIDYWVSSFIGISLIMTMCLFLSHHIVFRENKMKPFWNKLWTNIWQSVLILAWSCMCMTAAAHSHWVLHFQQDSSSWDRCHGDYSAINWTGGNSFENVLLLQIKPHKIFATMVDFMPVCS